MTRFFVWGSCGYAKKLARALNCRHGLRWSLRRPGQVVICWDHRPSLSTNQVDITVVNAELPTNKYEELRLIARALPRNTIPHGLQPITESTPEGCSIGEDDWIGRKFHHQGGKDISFYTRNPRGWLRADYFTLWVDKQAEYRAHVVDKKVIRSCRKIYRGGGTPLIANYAGNWLFDYAQTMPSQFRRIAIKAVTACGLDFGAVDILVDQNNKPFVLEVNAAPGLESDTTTLRYADAFRAKWGVNNG